MKKARGKRTPVKPWTSIAWAPCKPSGLLIKMWIFGPRPTPILFYTETEARRNHKHVRKVRVTVEEEAIT